MTTQPIQLNDLDVIGYADVLPEGKGPAVVPPVFQHRTEPARCFAPPFRVAGNWLIEPQCIAINELRDLEADESVTLPKDFKHPARPDYQLWVDENGAVRYEPSSEARRNQNRIHLAHLGAAVSALHEGRIEEARRLAGVALAANDRAVEPRALIAALHALRGETVQARFMRKSAEQAGTNGDSFTLLVKNYLESIPPETWVNFYRNLEEILETCSKLGFEVWVPSRFTEEEFVWFRPILHQFRRAGGEWSFVVSCPGNEAVLMAERETLLVAYKNAENHIEDVKRTNIFSVAADTMIIAAGEIAEACQKELRVVERLGKKLRLQVRPRHADGIAESKSA